MSTFVIKHKSGGRYIQPAGGSLNPDNDTELVIHEHEHEGMHFAFDRIGIKYGYIRHVGSGKCIHPSGGSVNPGDNTGLVLHQDRHDGALFYIDTHNHHIRHQGGKYIHPQGGKANPGNDSKLVLHGDRHDHMEFVIVSPWNTSQEITLYNEVPQLSANTSTFVIKHKSGGRYTHPSGGSFNPRNDTGLVIHEHEHEGMHFAFDRIGIKYGYIRHVGSGKCIHPSGGSVNPGDNTGLVLHQDRHDGALFYIDTHNHHIRHQGGKYIHPQGGKANPGNDSKLVLHGDRHDHMEFVIVSPWNTSQEITLYNEVPQLSANTSTFVIKHKSGGRYTHPSGGSFNPRNDTGLVIHEHEHDGMHFAFDRTGNGYGYSRHVGSGKCIHPSGGSVNPGDNTGLVLHQDRHDGALFYIDTHNHHIRHQGGKYIHPQGGKANPGNDSKLVLHGDRHGRMEFLIVSPLNTNEEVNP